MRIVPLASLVVLAACDRGAPPPAVPASPPAVVAAPPVAKPSLLASADVDARLQAAWSKAGVAPTARADDATWLRRAWIDVLGTIPPPEVTTRFLADRTADKRARMIDELLASPRWADHWTAYWDDVLMGRMSRAPDVDRGAFRAFLHASFARNAPWSEVATELLTATGRNSQGGPLRLAYANEGSSGEAEGVNGAVNWTLRFQDAPQDLAGTASRTFLGVQIQCAQCHDHKTEKWTQDDFESLRRGVRANAASCPSTAARRWARSSASRCATSTAPRPASRRMRDLGAIPRARPRALDGTDLGRRPPVRARRARAVDDRARQPVVRARVRQPHVGPLPRARLRRSGRRPARRRTRRPRRSCSTRSRPTSPPAAST